MTQSSLRSSPPDYWEVLGLQPGADAVTLKRAFRAQARRWHPDLNSNDPLAEERFKLINEAYAVLSDARRREAWETGGGTGGQPGVADPYAEGFPPFEDYLADLFGERRSQRRSPGAGAPAVEEPDQHVSAGSAPVTPAPAPPPPVQAHDDLETVVELSPEQALEGERVQLELADGTVVEVRTPPMAGDGWRLRLAGVAPGGADHFLQLRVRTPEGLRIDGLRVLYRLELSPAQAALGCRLTVPTLAGPVRLQVPACSSSGRLLRLRGRGLSLGGQRGDQMVELQIVLPDQLEEAEAALYRRLDELARDEDPLP